jgi:putative ABC transport system permease protein
VNEFAKEHEALMFSNHIIREAMRTLVRNPIRSCLTMLGIVMGVASFICVVAVGNAGSKRVQEQLRTLGDNMIWVEAGSRAKSGVRVGSRGTKTLIPGDAHAIKDEIPGVRSVSENVDGGVQLVYENKNWGTQFRGVNPEYFEIRKWEMSAGTAFDQASVETASPVCVLGKTVADNLFAEEPPLGKVIRVKGMPCNVIGVMKPKGAGPNGQDQDDFILLPVTTAQKRLSGTMWLDDIYISATSREDIPQATKDIVALLRERHHLRANEDNDFNIRSPEDVLRAQLQASQIFTFLLGGAASLSLLVGGIGIMNIMLVSVSQRTREIGIRIAVGATEGDVQLQFLSEAMALSIIGGLLGVAAGVGSAIVLQETLDWSMELSPDVMVIAGIVAAAIGILFGYYPAKTASRLDPMEILRSE